ncbi:MAG: hypothetical protein ACI9YE_002832 [Psychroserpens sp.]|jgi:hypothetical protein
MSAKLAENSEKLFIDLSGYALTGKSAVSNLLQEFEGFSVPDVEFEFGLLRMKDGLFDLEYSLVSDWSPLRSDAAIRRFIRLVTILGAGYRRYSLKWATSPSGYNYHKMIHPDFLAISLEYVKSIIDEESFCYWPFYLHDIHSFDCFAQRLKYFFFKDSVNKDKKYISFGDNFLEKTHHYLHCLFSSGDYAQVMNNTFEPYRASEVSKYFGCGKSIVVDRDPRAIFAASKESRYSDFTEVSSFIKYFKETRKRAEFSISQDNVLLINFEDLINSYEQSLEKIYNFLGVDEKLHVNKGIFFNPKKSAENLDKWKIVLNSNEILAIENNLK